MPRSSNGERFETMLRLTIRATEGHRIGCPDSAMLAAYHERALSPAEQGLMEEHLAECGRCRAELRSILAAELAAPSSSRRFSIQPWWIRWWAGMAVSATIVLLIGLGIGRELFEVNAPPAARAPLLASSAQPTAQSVLGAHSASLQRFAPHSAIVAAPEAPPPPPSESETRLPVPKERPESGGQLQPETGRAALGGEAPSALGSNQQQMAPSRALEAARGAGRPQWLRAIVVSPDGTVRWDIGNGGRIERIAAGGKPRPVTSGVTTDFLAGSAPSGSVCWIVGRDGVIIRTTDGGLHWERLKPPAGVDLTSITAQSERDATVVATDSRLYATTDGGLTWHRQR